MDKRLTVLGDRLRRLRCNQNMSIRDLESISNVDKNQILRIEQGEADPKYTTLCRIADALEISMRDLVDDGNRVNTLDGSRKG
ncbi:MAG: helix-turn-helix domain-containing protein [Acutalibacteraceae bacterium]